MFQYFNHLLPFEIQLILQLLVYANNYPSSPLSVPKASKHSQETVDCVRRYISLINWLQCWVSSLFTNNTYLWILIDRPIIVWLAGTWQPTADLLTNVQTVEYNKCKFNPGQMCYSWTLKSAIRNVSGGQSKHVKVCVIQLRAVFSCQSGMSAVMMTACHIILLFE